MIVARNATQKLISAAAEATPASTLRAALLLTGFLVSGGIAVAQTTLPDAQVESNVLKALASAPELATESITTKTVYGTVTLSGTVRDESTRRRAENLASTSDGVKKVVDELSLSSQAGLTSPDAAAPQQAQGPQMVLQSDGTYAPAPAVSTSNGQAANPDGTPAPGSAPAAIAQRNNPAADYQLDQQREQQQQGTQDGGNLPPQPPPMPNQQAQGQAPNQPYPDPNYPAGRRPLNPQGYPYPQQQGYPPYAQQQQNSSAQQRNPYGQQPNYSASQQPYGGQPMYGGGQVAGQSVVIPSGSLLRIRVSRSLSSNRTPAGTVFDGIVTNDVVSGGVIAIPRGAGVTGTVVDAKSSGVLKGRGEMSIQLTQVTLGGKTYPIVSDVWAHNGGDKTIETINKTAGFGAGGALVGALAGGGEGAAIGAGVGAALGLGSSAASGRGQVFIPAEGVITFHLAQAAPVQTVSEQEMQRLAYGVPAGGEGPARYRRYPQVVVAPGYYPGAYGPYGPAY